MILNHQDVDEGSQSLWSLQKKLYSVEGYPPITTEIDRALSSLHSDC